MKRAVPHMVTSDDSEAVQHAPAGLEPLEGRLLLSASLPWAGDALPDRLTGADVVAEPIAVDAGFTGYEPVSSSRLLDVSAPRLLRAASLTLPGDAVGRYRVSGVATASPGVIPSVRFRAGLNVTSTGVDLGKLPDKAFGVRVVRNTLPEEIPFVSKHRGRYRFRATGIVELRGYGEEVTADVRIGGKVFKKNGKWKIAGQIVAEGRVRGVDIVLKAPARGRWVRAL